MSAPVFDALEGVLATFTAAGVDGLEVLDGGPSLQPPKFFVCVGWTGVQGEDGCTVERVTQGARRVRYDVAVHCLLSLVRKQPLATVRGQVGDAWDALNAAVENDRTLGGAVMTASASPAGYQPGAYREGTLVELRWTVDTQKLVLG